MIQELVDRFIAAEAKTKKKIAAKRPSDYTDIVRSVVEIVTNPEDDWADDSLDPDRIHRIDDGDYQGTLVFVIGAKGYQPDEYWYVKVSYGSCSGCDTLQAIEESWEHDAALTEREIQGYYTLMLHTVQGLKKMGGE